ncbi:aminomethyl-transferring glycine dehydrogenase subunit GcvPA [Roseiconus lacunae]|uniref:aminomethyl-transferring glycine dehydrogenase subunit GcvPA n=1 Tax=Roseiconus lacunae TaxID=2605694 RepID=UPI0011F35387|nr:aminomethyl-transferring glycine dehydrogenase subunit GcvPA [Roseiconus lacunae]MCD0458345.1 aminomethyl-transferring glycine dehydrogenase subunit GcvPA [Roseiconus lacunae]WRQ52162.1 aminomethyl-transferring glycine dehydrogenase subunit GcvPA [Stieleria sp. HD01]
MKGYLFHTDDDRREMLRSIGAESIDEIIDGQVPQALQMQRPLDLPPAADEMSLEAELRSLAAKNCSVASHICFMGAGAYDHFIPAVVDEMASRGEYYTSYTPYQAEVSQGNLQVMFEYETMVSQISGLDVSNASLYDGGSAATEAVLMALASVKKRHKVVTSDAVHPQYLEILRSYLVGIEAELVVVESDESGCSDPLIDAIDDETACVLIQHPNFFGRLEQVQKIADTAHEKGALVIQSFDPISVGLLKRPGDLGVDIAVAEGQSLGNPLAYGGPYLGIIACRKELMRRMPGRIAGQTIDRRGNRCWVLTLQTREQHIRREKATSNICSNQTLLALRATVYLSLLGPQGLKETAEHCVVKANLARDRFAASERFELVHSGPVFKEFLVRDREADVTGLMRRAAAEGVLAGVPVSDVAEGACGGRYDDCFLVAVTEKRTETELDRLMAVLDAAQVADSVHLAETV